MKSSATLFRAVAFVAAFSISAQIGFAAEQKTLAWRDVEPGYQFGEYYLSPPGAVIKSRVILAKFDPSRFSFHIVRAAELPAKRAEVRTLVTFSGALGGINAHFFDEKENPLGLIVEDGDVIQRMQQGGGLLTGIFLVRNGKPQIIHRKDFPAGESTVNHITEALQSGPRLIAGGKAVAVESTDSATRRSGVAITKSGEVLLFATELRFPGATFADIQRMLLDPELSVTEALNLDGGGSSQLYLAKSHSAGDEFLVTGGDRVPTVLIVRRKEEPE